MRVRVRACVVTVTVTLYVCVCVCVYVCVCVCVGVGVWVGGCFRVPGCVRAPMSVAQWAPEDLDTPVPLSSAAKKQVPSAFLDYYASS